MRKRSIAVISLIAAISFCLILFNVVYLLATSKHLLSNTNMQTYAKEQKATEVKKELHADRGKIYDYNGRVLANDVYLYKIIAVLDETRKANAGEIAYVKDKQDTANKLAPLLNTTPDVLMEYLNQTSYQVEFGAVGKNIDVKTKEKIEELDLPGIEFEEVYNRFYPDSMLAPYLIGYAQIDDEKNVTVGKMGIEYRFDKELQGKNGSLTYIANTQGYQLAGTESTEVLPIDGNDIYLTIDTEIQRSLSLALQSIQDSINPEKSWAILMHKSGRILAMDNRPTFDLSKKENIQYYFDHTVDYPFEPGSVMKPFVYAAAMSEGVYPYDQTFQSGNIELYDSYGNAYAKIRDANVVGWGTISFDEGLMYSSNVGIVNLLTREGLLKPDTYFQYLDKLGFFKETGIELPSEGTGYRNTQTVMDQIATGYGQGSMITGIQLVQAYSAFANDGRTVKPYVVDRIEDPNTKETVYKHKVEYSDQIFTSEAVNKTNELMSMVVNDDRGTGRMYRMDEVSLIGKTGTAELAKPDGSGYYYGIFESINSVVVLFPAEDPQYILYISVERPKDYVYQPVSSALKDVVRRTMSQMNIQSNVHQSTENTVHNIDLASYVNQSVQFTSNKLQSIGARFSVLGTGQSVLKQSPDPHETISSLDRVFIISDSGPYLIPDMTGWSSKDALRLLSALEIKYTIEGVGFVTSQSIPPNTEVNNTSEIHLVLE